MKYIHLLGGIEVEVVGLALHGTYTTVLDNRYVSIGASGTKFLRSQ